MVPQVLGYFASQLLMNSAPAFAMCVIMLVFFQGLHSHTVGQNNSYQSNGRDLYPTENITEYTVVCLCKFLYAELPLLYP